MTEHISRKEDNTRHDRRLFDHRFRQQCSCGWEARGWFVHSEHGDAAWGEHVREAKAKESTA